MQIFNFGTFSTHVFMYEYIQISIESYENNIQTKNEIPWIFNGQVRYKDFDIVESSYSSLFCLVLFHCQTNFVRFLIHIGENRGHGVITDFGVNSSWSRTLFSGGTKDAIKLFQHSNKLFPPKAMIVAVSRAYDLTASGNVLKIALSQMIYGVFIEVKKFMILL